MAINYKFPSRQKKCKCRCIETGKVFNSLTEAALSIGTSSGSISNACRNGTPAGRLHWEYYTDEAKE